VGVGLDTSLSIITGHLVGGLGTGQPKDGIEAGDGARGLQASSLRERRISRGTNGVCVCARLCLCVCVQHQVLTLSVPLCYAFANLKRNSKPLGQPRRSGREC
jgi:hypothetical protein